jgi:hypothetical protein
MHPDITHALAHARISDLHREAAQRRLARQAAPRHTNTIRDTWIPARSTAAAWIIERSRQTATACCSPSPDPCPN